MRIRLKKNPLKGDRVIWIIMTIMCLASLLVVTSSTASLAYKRNDLTYFFFNHLFHVVCALGGAFILQYVKMEWWKRWGNILFLFIVFLLLVVGFFGAVINSAARWAFIPIIDKTFQPSYAAKILLVIVLAYQLAQRKNLSKLKLLPSLNPMEWQRNYEENMNILIRTTLPILMPVAVVCFLIMLSNLSTAIMIGVCSLIMIKVSGIKWREISRLLGFVLVVAAFLFSVLYAAGFDRMETWGNRIKGYFVPQTEQVEKSAGVERIENQVYQSKVAIASAGIFGKGPGNSTQRSNLPLAHADYAYAFIIEEYGIVGAIIVLIMYLTIFYRSFLIAKHSRSHFNGLISFGLGLTVMIQAAVNMGVSVSLIPVTGQSLPFLSHGGSSLLFTGISLGIIQSIARQNEEEDMAEAERIDELEGA